MRLLKFSAGGFSLTGDLSSDNLPPYAILSHTWGLLADEVMYEDIVEGRDKTNPKLEFCRQKAIRDGLQYFWIDTCCIDMSNLAERSEASVSMFQWFQKAVRCYVYLSDVSTETSDGQLSDWDTSFRNSRWFTRAWTLQELLAPSSVEFFSREGVRLGDKSTLKQQIYEISGLAMTAIEGRNLLDFSFEEIIRCAKSRESTLEEDKIYCLFGIFGVSLPVIYGEGLANAERRLREEIKSASTSLEAIIGLAHPDTSTNTANLSAALKRRGQLDGAIMIDGHVVRYNNMAIWVELPYEIRILEGEAVETRKTNLSDSGYGTASYCTNRLPYGLGALDSIREDFDDKATIYSDTSSRTDARFENYSTMLADNLAEMLGPSVLDEEVLHSAVKSLPDLLQTLALKLGFQAPSKMHRDAMVFIHKNRNSIAHSFRQTISAREDLPDDLTAGSRETVTTEIFDRFLRASDEEFDPVPEPVVDESGLTADVDEDLHSDEYKSLIFDDPGYEWLLQCLRNSVLLARPVPDNLQTIHEAILKAIPTPNHMSRRTSSKGCSVTYTVDWDPFAFLDAQEYEEPDHEVVAKVITVTGHCRDAQALSVQDYLSQTWPSSGPGFLRLIQTVIRNRGLDMMSKDQVPNGTELLASYEHHTGLSITASGVPGFVAEIGEQLAWLGAALRLPDSELPVPTSLIRCVPFVDEIRHLGNESGRDKISCSIRFLLEESKDASTQDKGQCWYGLFQRPLFVEGFPVSRRPKADTGLEIPLDMAAALVGARTVELFNQNVFIKGFSAMLVPTEKLGDTIVWHLIRNQRPNERISYLDCGLQHKNVYLAEMDRARHIVGWYSEADCDVGTKRANYSIKKSGLPKPHTGCVLEHIEVQGGQYIMATGAFAIGKRQPAAYMTRNGYIPRMDWISSRYIILWDEKEKRGWLVNGARALLRLLRASLRHSKDKFGSAFLLDPDDLTDVDCTMDSKSALDILLDENIRTRPLYVDKYETTYEEKRQPTVPGRAMLDVEGGTYKVKRYHLLEDHIEHIFSKLEKLVDHQAQIEGQNGLRIDPRPRRQLEGWDFWDLATESDPIFPKVSTLDTIRKGWVDFSRAIRAVCLFGKGFGDLIKPGQTAASVTASTILCPRWSLLPAQRSYLAVCVTDIQKIIDDYGDIDASPVRICDSVLWHMKQTAFQACPCAVPKEL